MRIAKNLIVALLSVSFSIFADDTINIPDPQLDVVIRQELNKPTGPLTSNNMAGLLQLVGNSRGITNLTGLQAAVNLNFLNVQENEISDISPLLELTSLETLNLSFNRLTSISGIGALHKLKSLGLAAPQIWFGVEGTGIADLSPLSGLTNLQFLGVALNHPTNVAITNVPALEFFDLGYCGITNISFITNFPTISQLALDGNRLTNIAPVAALPQLRVLTVRVNLLTNIPALHLFNLPSLWWVGLEYNYIDLNRGSEGRRVIQNLLTNGVHVEHGGQTYSPRLELVVTNSVSPGASAFLEFDGDSWSRYAVEQSFDFGFWGEVTEVHALALQTTRVPVRLDSSATFFRLRRTEFGVAP